MGWFLTGKKKSSRPRAPRNAARKAKPDKADGGKWDPQRTLAGLKVLLAVGLILTTVLGWRSGRDRLMEYVKTHHGAPVKTEGVALQNGPAWMSKVLARDLRGAVADQLTDDPMDNNSLQKAVMALRSNPWVERVDRIQRSANGAVKVVGVYREPVALVAAKDGYHLVDVKGVRVPGVYTADQVERVGLPLITGVKALPPREGQTWSGDDLKAGLDLVALLAAQPYLFQVKAFDVSERDALNRLRLVLRTEQGMVRWGLPPGQEQAIEPDALTKKQWLANLFRNRGAIDAGGRVVDVFGAAVFVHKPEEENPEVRVGYDG